MLSSRLPAPIALLVKVLGLAAGVAAALVGWWAARLWRKASAVEVEDTTPLHQVSYSDVPEFAGMDAQAANYAIQRAFAESSALNKEAARWTGWAAVLAGAAGLLSSL